MPLRVGLLGAGRIGQVHAKNIAADSASELVAIADVVAAAASQLAAAYGAKSTTTDAILADATIDAILIASSTNTHADLIEAGIAVGKAVFCEKPIDLSLARAQACLSAVAAQGKPVMVGFNRRFDVNFAALKTAYDADEIGHGELLTVTSYDPAPPPVSYIEVSGGLFRDMMIHDFDMACWLFGAVPETVTARGSSIVSAEIGQAGDIDTAVVTLEFPGGPMAVIKNSRRAVYGYDQRVEFLGAKGLLSADNILENTVVKATVAGVIAAKPEFFFLERYHRAYAAEWSRFVDAVTNATPVPVTVADGVNALAIAEAANRSHETGRTVSLASVITGAAT